MPPALRIGLSLTIAAGTLGALLYLIAPGVVGVPPKITWETWDVDYGIRFDSKAECDAWRAQVLASRSKYRPPVCTKRVDW